jgi:hypothetical protein
MRRVLLDGILLGLRFVVSAVCLVRRVPGTALGQFAMDAACSLERHLQVRIFAL